jgi:hypothetical protein
LHELETRYLSTNTPPERGITPRPIEAYIPKAQAERIDCRFAADSATAVSISQAIPASFIAALVAIASMESNLRWQLSENETSELSR